MIIYKLLDRADRAKKRKARMQTAVTCAAVFGVAAAIGSGVIAGIICSSKSGKEKRDIMIEKAVGTAEDIKDKIIQNVKTVKDVIFNAKKEVTDVVEDICEKKDDIKDDLQNGSDKFAKVILEAADSISKDL